MYSPMKAAVMKIAGYRRHFGALAIGALALSAVGLLASPAAMAEPAYISQVSGTLRSAENFAIPTARGAAGPAARATAVAHPTAPAVPSPIPGSGGNTALSIQAGINNTISQLQLGARNQSAVAVLGGHENNVGVLQAGNGLRSQVALVNTQGLNVGVLQPNNSAPVNVFIARLPNGGLLIKR
ncbi:hypothetical protein [Microvirga sp. Mcv34]|uniref:hypothetical protein n=1 Tax=Microvirga sp. Mcv34 TaxID=2926016 RepID=UPI0021C671AF|nr:hypothetical protein [Microvirga sp. Mcv34]